MIIDRVNHFTTPKEAWSCQSQNTLTRSWLVWALEFCHQATVPSLVSACQCLSVWTVPAQCCQVPGAFHSWPVVARWSRWSRCGSCPKAFLPQVAAVTHLTTALITVKKQTNLQIISFRWCIFIWIILEVLEKQVFVLSFVDPYISPMYFSHSFNIKDFHNLYDNYCQ